MMEQKHPIILLAIFVIALPVWAHCEDVDITKGVATGGDITEVRR